MHPSFMKIVRVKNRLATGNRDILINLMYRNSLIIEMQLAKKSGKSDFIERSNAFNHYIYELKRSKFGPLSELCNIWMEKDYRGTFFKKELNKQA